MSIPALASAVLFSFAALSFVACTSEVAPAPKRAASSAEVPVAPQAQAEDVKDLGSAASGTPIAFDVPPNTLGFTLVATAPVASGDSIGVAELRDPSGNLVVDDYEDAFLPSGAVARQTGSGVVTLRVPLVNDRATAPVPSGRWTVTFGGSTRVPGAGKGSTTPWSGTVHGGVRFQVTRDGAFNGGAIDLDLYVPDGLEVSDASGATHAIDAASAPGDAALKERLDHAFGLFQRLYGIDRGEVRFHRIASTFASLRGQPAVDAANMLATETRASAQVILTNHLDPDDTGGEISGVANCLGGAVGVPGTSCSAIVVSLRSDSPAWQDASVLVHELGHFVGLHHTTELDGLQDELTDTPACTSTEKNALASCPGHDNIMFPSVNLATDEASITASETQRALFRSSAVYRAGR